jgi:hypothetical protein
VLEPECRVLGVPLQCLVVHMDNAEPRGISEPPLEVIKQRPCEVTNHLGTIICSLVELDDVVSVISDPHCVMVILTLPGWSIPAGAES